MIMFSDGSLHDIVDLTNAQLAQHALLPGDFSRARANAAVGVHFQQQGYLG
jgi:hypothetical protein